MLKVLRLILNHDIIIEKALKVVFKKICDLSDNLTESFALTKERIKDVEFDIEI